MLKKNILYFLSGLVGGSFDIGAVWPGVQGPLQGKASKGSLTEWLAWLGLSFCFWDFFLLTICLESNLCTAYPISAVAAVSISSLVAELFSTFSRSSVASFVSSFLFAFTSPLISSSCNSWSAPDFCHRTHSRLSKMAQWAQVHCIGEIYQKPAI